MCKVKSIVFDFDGTLADTRPAILATVRATLVELGLPPVPDDRVQPLIGLPLAETFSRAAGIADRTALERAVEIYRRLFVEAAHAVRLFPGVAEVLARLHAGGVTMGVASSHGHESLDRLVRMLGLERYFRVVCGEEDAAAPKPAPDLVLRVLESLGVCSSEALVVGDTSYDILMGINAGCRTCGVTYGNHSRERLEAVGADFVVDDFILLPAVLENIRVGGDVIS